MAGIGIMSFAHMHANAYAAAVNDLDDADLVAVWDDVQSRGKKAAKEFGTDFEKDVEKFLKLELDGVIVTSENVKHREMVEIAAKAGMWVLCEKPIAPNVKDAEAMVDACEKAEVGLGTAFPCRYIPAMKAVKKLIDTGGYGKIFAASCTNNGQFPGGWFADNDLSGGGATMDHTVHIADALRWLTGKEFTKVYCEIGTVLHPNLKTDDVGSLHMEMEGGVIVSHIASWNRPKSFPTWGDVTIEFIAENGVINVDAFNQKIDVYDDEAMASEWAYWGGDPNRALIADFVQAIHEQRAPSVTGVDGLRAVEVTAAAYKSANTGNVVEL